MIRGIFYWVFGTVFTILVAFAFYILYPILRINPNIPHLIVKFWSNGLLTFFCGADIEVIGRRNIDLSKNYIIVSNHRSHMDIPLASVAVPLQFRWLSKSSLFKIPVFGLAMKIAGYVSVERSRSISASRSLDRVKDVLEEGKSVWIFSEGTRTPRDELGKFKRGAFLLAKDTKKPLLPVILVHTDKIFYRPYIVRRRTVKVIVCEPLYYNDFIEEKMSDRDVMSRMSQSVRELIQKKYNSAC